MSKKIKFMVENLPMSGQQKAPKRAEMFRHMWLLVLGSNREDQTSRFMDEANREWLESWKESLAVKASNASTNT